MPVNKATLKLIKSFEGWRSRAYPDPASGGVPWTIGFGHTTAAGPPTVGPGLQITKSQGEEILQRDLGKYAKAVRAKVKVDLNENQFGALVSFCYNVGPGNFNKSSVLNRVNAGLFDMVPARLLPWNKAAGRIMAGLTRRRKAEGELFMAPVFVAGDSHTHQPDDPGVIAPKPPQSALWGLLRALISIIKAIFGRKS